MLDDDLDRIDSALNGVYKLALGGYAVGTGINAAPGLATRLPSKSPNSPGYLLPVLPISSPCRALTMLLCNFRDRSVLSLSRSTRSRMISD